MRRYCLGLVACSSLLLACNDPAPVAGDESSSSGDSEDPLTGSMSEPTAGTTPQPTTVTTTTATTTMGVTTIEPTTVDPTVPTTATDSADGTDTDDIPECLGVGEGRLELDEPCLSNDDCFTGVCPLFSDAPPDPGAVCEPWPEDCSMRITGTALDIVTQQPIPGAELVIASALEAATNPTGADPLAMATSEADGHIDTESFGPPDAPIGLVALASFPDFSLTATGLAAPADGASGYAVANDIHDLWLVSNPALAAWSVMLGLDPAVDPADLPLGAAGGMVGLARDATGTPLAGVSVTSLDGGSVAVVRYLNLDGTFNPDSTTGLGLFIIVAPSLAEGFEATFGGAVFDELTAGSTNGAVFTAAVTNP